MSVVSKANDMAVGDRKGEGVSHHVPKCLLGCCCEPPRKRRAVSVSVSDICCLKA